MRKISTVIVDPAKSNFASAPVRFTRRAAVKAIALACAAMASVLLTPGTIPAQAGEVSASSSAGGAVHKLVLMRHGESQWNLENRFTGWTDVDLTEKGREEARKAGQLLKADGYTFDIAYTSLLKRAIHSLWIVLDELDLAWIPVTKSWRLNERHYGALQGLNKSETAEKFGEKQVLIWRRSYATPPEPLPAGDPRHPAGDPRYAALSPQEIPAAECLKDTVARVVPFWEREIKPAVASGRKVLIAAHGNSLRALVKHIDGISDEAIVGINIPTGRPLVYEFDADMKPIRHYYLGDAKEIEAAKAAVAAQGKAKK